MFREHTITLGPWEFVLGERSGEWFFSVPDCGGMADSFPRVPEQLAWTERTLAALPELVQVGSSTKAHHMTRRRAEPAAWRWPVAAWYAAVVAGSVGGHEPRRA